MTNRESFRMNLNDVATAKVFHLKLFVLYGNYIGTVLFYHPIVLFETLKLYYRSIIVP